MTPLVLVSHALCPYVQRVAIVLDEKGVPFERRDIDLADKPAWFLALSPTGKTPMLLVGDEPLFESAVICDYLDDVVPPRLHPVDALARARHRAWSEYASGVLAAIAALYLAPDSDALATRAATLRAQLAQVERALGDGPYFGGAAFSIVDAAFAPALRYLDVLEEAGPFGLIDGLPTLAAWRTALLARPSVGRAVAADYPERLRAFLRARDSAFGRAMRGA